MANQTTVTHATISDLFNKLQSFNSVFVIDTRPVADFRRGHVINALSIPVDKCSRCSSLDDVAKAQTSDANERFLAMPHKGCVIIYGDGGESDDWADRLALMLVESVQHSGGIPVSVLEGGYSQFAKTFGFLSNSGVTDGDAGTVYPNDILDSFLFLGNGRQAVTEKVIRDLAITHVVDASNTPECRGDFDGVEYLRVLVDDHHTEDMGPYMPTVADFIVAARNASPSNRVLVHCQAGISRSATLCIYTLMLMENWPLRRAFAHVLRRRPAACPSLEFRKQLLLAERQMRGRVSVSEGELAFIGPESDVGYDEGGGWGCIVT